MNQEMLETAKNCISMGLIFRDGENAWKVDDQIVLNKIKEGRSYLSCSCFNSSMFTNENPDCCHKLAVIILESRGKFNQVADKIIEICEKSIKINAKLNPETVEEYIKLMKYSR